MAQLIKMFLKKVKKMLEKLIKKECAATPQESILKLRETEKMLMKKQDFLEKKIQQETQTARKNASANKRIALQALKRKKHHEKQQLHIDGVLQRIEYQRKSLERNLSIFISEQQDVANEIAGAIANPIGFGNDIDESVFLAELEEFEEETINEKLITVGQKNKKEEDDMAELEQWATS